MNDFELVSQAKKGNRKAYEALARRYSSIIHERVAQKISCPEAAADVAQIVLMAALQLKRYRGESSFRRWIFSILSKQIKNYYRRQKSMSQLTDSMLIHFDFDPIIQERLLNAIEKSFSKIKPCFGDAFQMRLIGFTQFEIAKAMDIKYETARSRTSRGATSLRKKLLFCNLEGYEPINQE